MHVSSLAAALMALAIVSAAGRHAAAAGQAATPTGARTIPSDQGVLQGRVVETGSDRPVAGAQVQALSASGTFEATTDDDGRYEITALVPDSYTVAARANGFVDSYYGQSVGASLGLGAPVVVRGGQPTAGIDLAMQVAGRISGRILSSKGDGVAGVEIELMPRTPLRDAGRGVAGWARTGDDGAYALVDVAPGDYVVRAYLGRDADAAIPADAPSLVYAATFYPGVPDRELAQPLRVYGGQESFDVDFPLVVTRLFTVAGTVVDEQGESLDGVTVRLVSTDPNGGPREGRMTSIDGDGRFVFRDVAPGSYVARLAAPIVFPGPPMPGAMGRAMTASKTVAVVDSDVLDLELRVVVFPSDAARWQFSPRTIRAVSTDTDGRFQIEALPPGRYQAIAVPNLGLGAAPDAAVLERLTGTSETIRVAAGQQLTLSMQASALPAGLEP